MFSGKVRRNRAENLQAFWPGMETLLGLRGSSARILNTFYAVWRDVNFLPEEFDQAQWLEGKPAVNSLYPLRPELIESTYYQYRATGWVKINITFIITLLVSHHPENNLLW
jgi:hypothetical protein